MMYASKKIILTKATKKYLLDVGVEYDNPKKLSDAVEKIREFYRKIYGISRYQVGNYGINQLVQWIIRERYVWPLDNPNDRIKYPNIIDDANTIIGDMNPESYFWEHCKNNMDMKTYAILKNIKKDLRPLIEASHNSYAMAVINQLNR